MARMAGKAPTQLSSSLGLAACNMLLMMHQKILNKCLLEGLADFLQIADERREGMDIVRHLRDEISRIMDNKTEYTRMKAEEALLHKMRNYLETPSKNEKEEADKTVLADAIAHSARMGANLETAEEMQNYLDGVLAGCAEFGVSQELIEKFRDDKDAFEKMSPEEIAGAEQFSKSADEYINLYDQLINQTRNTKDLDSKYQNAMEQLDKAGIHGNEFMTIQKELKALTLNRDQVKKAVICMNEVLKPYQEINMNPRAMNMIRNDINIQTEAERRALNAEEDRMDALSSSIARMLNNSGEKLSEQQKNALVNMEHTLKEMSDRALDSLGKASEILKLEQGIDIAAEEATRRDRPLSLYKINVDERAIENVSTTLTQFHFPHECFTSMHGESGIILHSTEAAKACLAVVKKAELDLCKRNIMHPASLTAYLTIANGYGKVYDGYTKEQAEFIREKAASRNIAMAVLEPDSQNGKYRIAFESTKANNSMMLIFSAEAIAITHGAGKESGSMDILAGNALAREGAASLFNHIGNGEKNRYMVEIDPKNPDHRLYISAEGMMEINGFDKKWIPRSKNAPAQQYEAAVYDRCSNFCKRPLVLPDHKAEECGISYDISKNKEAFEPNEKFKDQLKGIKDPIVDLDSNGRGMAKAEQSFISISTRFMMHGIKDNSLLTPEDVYKYIQDNFDLCAANYKEVAKGSQTLQKYEKDLEQNGGALRADIDSICSELAKDGHGFETHEYTEDAGYRSAFDKTDQINPVRKEWERVQKAAEAALNGNRHEVNEQERDGARTVNEEREQQDQVI